MALVLPSKSSPLPFGALFSSYDLDVAYDEMFEPTGRARPHCGRSSKTCAPRRTPSSGQRQLEADKAFLTQGITFTVYGDDEGTERIFPFDLLPRIITAPEWRTLERGLTQRLTAINLFLKDVYHEGASSRKASCRASWCRAAGTTAARCAASTCTATSTCRSRAPISSGSRTAGSSCSKTTCACRAASPTCSRIARSPSACCPGCSTATSVRPIAHYGQALLATLRALAPPDRADPTFVVLTPGVGNSAYFEHAFLAREMGVALVEGRDLLVHDNIVYMRTTAGLRRVDVIYRRVDDDFLDPLAFRADSHLGVAGLLNAYRAGNVSLANAIGTGLADDKALYAYIPAIIRFYLSKSRSCRTSRPICWRTRPTGDTSSSISTRSSSRRWASRAATAC